MKLQFQADQAHQLEACQAIVDIFEGQPMESGEFAVELVPPSGQLQIGSDLLIGNRLVLAKETILSNVQAVQRRFNQQHGKKDTASGEQHSALEVSDKFEGMHFSVEMETGTGKTYVYLRTIHELHRRYGFKKFVIVVPSIAIKEGVIKNHR